MEIRYHDEVGHNWPCINHPEKACVWTSSQTCSSDIVSPSGGPVSAKWVINIHDANAMSTWWKVFGKEEMSVWLMKHIFFPLQKVTGLCYTDSPISDNALRNGGTDNCIMTIRTPFAVLKVSVWNRHDVNFPVNLEVITQQQQQCTQLDIEKQSVFPTGLAEPDSKKYIWHWNTCANVCNHNEPFQCDVWLPSMRTDILCRILLHFEK